MRRITAFLPDSVADDVLADIDGLDGLVSVASVGLRTPADHVQLELVLVDEAFNDAIARFEAVGALVDGVVVSQELAAVEGRRAEAVAAENGPVPEAVNWDEVVQALDREATPGPTFLLFVALGSLIAMCGLIIGSIPILIGAMVIPPALSALLAIPVALQTTHWRLAVRGLLATGVTLVVSVATAWLATVVFRWLGWLPVADDFLTREIIKDRVSVSPYAAVVAVAAGLAGGFSITTNRPSQLVGVMISAALIPSAATIGLGLAHGNLGVARGASLLLGLNVALIMAGGFVAVLALRLYWRLRARPRR